MKIYSFVQNTHISTRKISFTLVTKDIEKISITLYNYYHCYHYSMFLDSSTVLLMSTQCALRTITRDLY